MEFIRLAGIAEIPEGEMRTFDAPAGRIAVAHVEHRLFAFGDECTHQGCSLAEGEFDDREAKVVCPCHGSVFDVETGERAGTCDRGIFRSTAKNCPYGRITTGKRVIPPTSIRERSAANPVSERVRRLG